MRICIECGREFMPSSGHHKCPRCRGREDKTGVCPTCGTTIQRRSRQCITCRNRSNTGSSNPSWKGGRTYHKAGYTMSYAPHHPRASSGYVFEHILVVENALGRHLYANENVHHRNGVKTDNRIENLELWTRPHPAGARVADLIDWAIELLQLYAPHLLKEDSSPPHQSQG